MGVLFLNKEASIPKQEMGFVLIVHRENGQKERKRENNESRLDSYYQFASQLVRHNTIKGAQCRFEPGSIKM